jgi:hypothetical protein
MDPARPPARRLTPICPRPALRPPRPSGPTRESHTSVSPPPGCVPRLPVGLSRYQLSLPP